MKKFICSVCGYIHEGDSAPERCPMCKVPSERFNELVENGKLEFVQEHVVGVAKGCDSEMIKDLNDHFMGECTEVGMYLAMSRQADREGYPEIAEADAAAGAPFIKKALADRISTIIPGILAYEQIFEFLGTKRATICASGVREGYLLSFIRRYLAEKTQEF